MFYSNNIDIISKDDKFTPLHLKRKKKTTGDLNKPHVFEIMPPSGIYKIYINKKP